MNPYKRAIQEHTVKAYLFAFISAGNVLFFFVGEEGWRPFVSGIVAWVCIEIALVESRKVDRLRHERDGA